MCESAHIFVSKYAMGRTDLCYFNNDDGAWYDFPIYKPTIPYHTYYTMMKSKIKKNGFSVQKTYDCPNRRGLDSFWIDSITEINEGTAERLARGMLPVCFVPHRDSQGDCYVRPELNSQQDNPTVCVMFDSVNGKVVYAFILWCPRDMNAFRFTQDRKISMHDADTHKWC